jgi:hypothetical protein
MIRLEDGRDHIDPTTNMVRPWLAHRGHHGLIRCFPTQGNLYVTDRRLFMSHFWRGRVDFDSKMQSQFCKRFPVFHENTNILAYLSSLVPYALQHCFYIPPLHTLSTEYPYGAWYEQQSHSAHGLPRYIRDTVPTIMANVLASCLRYKGTGLLSHPSYGAIVKSHDNGYHAYSALAALGGHPNLDDYTSEPVMPRQAPDMSLVDHGQNLRSHLHKLALGSIFWSDRYYVLQFLASCHPDIQDYFRPLLEAEVHTVDISTPLPAKYGPDGLIPHLLSYATWQKRSSVVTMSPRALCQANRPVQALTSHLQLTWPLLPLVLFPVASSVTKLIIVPIPVLRF